MPELNGQLAVVTGASSGLGEATAVRLAELGARVALLARSEAGLDRVAARISGAGGTAFAVPADLADPDAVVAAIERLVSGSGRRGCWSTPRRPMYPARRRSCRWRTGSGSLR